MLISVITPIFNAEAYVDSCLKSILAQTMPDFELLLIDDGSNDHSGQICDRYADQDQRIHVFHTPNQGLSAARNIGLDHAQGKFIVLVDADDFIEPDHLQQFLDSGIGEEGLAYSNFLMEKADGTIIEAGIPDAQAETPEAIEELITLLIRKERFGWGWAKIYVRATIEKDHLRFENGLSLIEDEVFTAAYCRHVKRIVCNSHATYHYRYVEKSVLHVMHSPEEWIRHKYLLLSRYEAFGYIGEIMHAELWTQYTLTKHLLKKNPAAREKETFNFLLAYLQEIWPKYRRTFRLHHIKIPRELRYLLVGWLLLTPRSSCWARWMLLRLHA